MEQHLKGLSVKFAQGPLDDGREGVGDGGCKTDKTACVKPNRLHRT